VPGQLEEGTITDGRREGAYGVVLHNRQYMIFLASANASTVGYSVYTISIVWLTVTLFHNFLDVGAVLFVEFACYTATFLVGPIVDRVRNQRTIFLLSYPVQALGVALIGLGYHERFLTIGLLLALVALISLLWDMSWAAQNAAPGVLLSPDEQFAASGLGGAIGGVLTIAGYGVGGALLLFVGADGGMYLYAALLLVAAALAIPLRISPPSKETRPTFLESFRDGWRLVLGGVGRPLLQLAAVDAIEGFFVSATAILIALVATVEYGDSTLGYAILFTASVIGGVVAGLALGSWNPRQRVGLVLAGSLFGAGAAFVVAVTLPHMLLLAAIAWFVVGVTTTAYTSAKFVFFRGSVAPEQIGRLFSNMYLFPGIAGSIGALVISDVALGGKPTALGIDVGIGFLVAGALAFALPGVRRMRY
jgi:DHA3 family macrolide efflux protein-like MFS transporter